MPKYSANAGLWYTEKMSGHVFLGHTDPNATAGLNPTPKSRLSFELQVEIDSVESFLNSQTHIAKVVSGTITWGEWAGGKCSVTGTLQMFHRVNGSRKNKQFVFTLHFAAPNGTPMRLEGIKHVRDHAGPDWYKDLTTLYCTIVAAGGIVAAGITRVGIADLLTLTMEGLRANDREIKAMRRDFTAFMNAEISEVYPDVPLLVAQPKRLSSEQLKAAEFLLKVLLPKNLPQAGPQWDALLENLQRFLRNSQGDQLAGLLSNLTLLGFVDDILQQVHNLDEWRRKVEKKLADPERDFLRDLLDQVLPVAAMPYWGDARSHAVIGFQRGTPVPRGKINIPVRAKPAEAEYDYVIIGGGVAGAVLADRLSHKGSVLVLEAGPYVPEYMVADGDEIAWSAKLYKQSGLQRAELTGISPTLTIPVLQGSCLGGGGMVNNIVCFRLPRETLKQWHSYGFPLDETQLGPSYDTIARQLHIRPVGVAGPLDPQTGRPTSAELNPAGEKLAHFFGAPKRPGSAGPWPDHSFAECLVNVVSDGCLGCGECNIACASERKNNGLQTYLPAAVKRGAHIVPEAEVRRIELESKNGSLRATEVWVDIPRVSDDLVKVRGKEFILCASAIGSPVALLRSPDVLDRLAHLPIGQHFGANIGSPLFAFYSEELLRDKCPGLQIAHYFLPEQDLAPFVLETWQNPPGATALAMPGFPSTHFDRMRQYKHQVAAAPLVGTGPTGTVEYRNGKTRIKLRVSDRVLATIKRGQSLLGRAFMHQPAAESKLDHLLYGVRGGAEARSVAELEGILARVQSPADLLLGSGHPQGGCAMADGRHGVVGADFRVKGVGNLRVCDASVFPSTAGVNPQWTVMALADYCASLM